MIGTKAVIRHRRGKTIHIHIYSLNDQVLESKISTHTRNCGFCSQPQSQKERKQIILSEN